MDQGVSPVEHLILRRFNLTLFHLPLRLLSKFAIQLFHKLCIFGSHVVGGQNIV